MSPMPRILRIALNAHGPMCCSALAYRT